ncbi:MAG: ROK family protein [Bacteroidales bacterium]|nr:ROK family protein [Bacteroidales bacterium]
MNTSQKTNNNNNSRMEVAIGIDIGGTNTVFGIIDRQGKSLADGMITTRDYEEVEVFLAALNEKIRLSLKKLNSKVSVAGIGVGSPMGNILKGTIENAVNLPWSGVIPLTELFKQYTDLPVIVTNDANGTAVGEMVYGGAKEMKNFIVITLGTGLGSGIVVDGKLLTGATGMAGEFGHTMIRPGPSNRECACGRKGCLETYVSVTGIKRTFFKILADSIAESSLRSVTFENLTGTMIYEAAKKGDIIAKKAFDHTGHMLGFKLADFVASFNPEAIFLFGGLSLAKEFIFIPTKKSLEDNLMHHYKGMVDLLPSKINSQKAAILGASALVWNHQENNK